MVNEYELVKEVLEKIELKKPIPLSREEIFRLGLRLGILQHCKGPKREFVRIRPYTYDFPSKKQIRQRLALAEEAFKRFETKGVVKLPDGREINKVAYELGQVLKKPKEAKPILTDEQVVRILEKIRVISLKI